MILVCLSSELLPDPAAIDEFNEHTHHGIRVEPYEGPHTIPLPDFNDSLTRMVYEGVAHSFMPPRSYEHQVLGAIRIDYPEELRIFDADYRRHGSLRWLDWEGGLTRFPHRSVAIIEFDRAILYVVPGSVSRLGDIDFHSMLEQLQSAQSELRGSMSSFGSLGLFAEALVGLICLHFTLLDGKPILLGTGPHYTRR